MCNLLLINFPVIFRRFYFFKSIFSSLGIGSKLATISTNGKVTNSATTGTANNNANTLVLRDGAGNFSAGTITANLNGNATSATTAGSTNTAINFSGPLNGDVIGTQNATVVNTVGGQNASNIASGTLLANGATAGNTGNAIVKRDPNGNFNARTITANLNGNATTANSSNTANSANTSISFSGPLNGDVTGSQNSTVVSTVGGQSAANVASGAALANAATSANSANTIVLRDGSDNFSAGTITAALTDAASLNVLKAGDTMTGTLQLPAGTAAAPSLVFTGGTTTDISAPTANRLSFDTNGVERMFITTAVVSQVLPLCNQAVQAVSVTGNNQSVSASATTSVLLLQPTANSTGLAITFPPSPTNGQYFTILLGSNNSVTVTNTAGAGAAGIVNAITTFSSAVGQAAVTYYYYAASNTWYRERLA